MKKIFFAAMVCFAALFAAACDKQPAEDTTPVEITLSVHPSTLNFSDTEESLQLRVETNAETIEISDNLTWISSTKTSDGYYGISAEENTDKDPREGELVVYAVGKDGTGKQAIVKVKQNGAGAKSQFEDEEFRRLVLAACDADGDGAISQDEADKVTELDLTFDSESEERVAIKSLAGIQIFRNLKNLDCDFNALTTLDLSGLEKLEYVNCSYNNLTALNLSGCVSLKQIYANVNKLKSLDINGFENLLWVQAYKNEFTSFTATGLPKLAYLQIDQNSLTKLTVHDCPELGTLNCGSNSLAVLDLKNLPKLYTLGCYNNSLTSLSVADFPELLMLECYSNNLTALDLSACPKLGSVRCSSNLLESIKLPATELFTYLVCDNNRLKSLDLTGYSSLKTLECSDNFIEALTLDGCASLEIVTCNNNALTALSLAGLAKLKTLSCTDNKLTGLDVTENAALTSVDCRRNEAFKTLWIADGQTSVLKDIKTDDNESIVKVKQDKPVITVTTAEVSSSDKGGEFSVGYSVENAVEGTALAATTTADWISGIVVEASQIKFTVAANTVESPRESKITLSYGDAEPVSVTVKQDAAAAPAELITVKLNYAWYEKYSFTVTTSDAPTTYIAYVRPKSKVEAYKTDDELITADIERYGSLSSSWDKYVGNRTIDGTANRGYYGSEYYVIVYGITDAGAWNADAVIKIPFTLASSQPVVSVGTVEKVPVDGGTYTVSYSVENEYDGEHISVESMDKSWLHIDKVDEAAKTITYTVDKNTKISYSYPYTREGSFIINYPDATPCDVTVKQDSPRSSN